ncbi:MAG: M20 family metallo-hydrolase [Synergistaceae bacterium]|nr:M20 family metallo-hydrolase [Synergistaceae bacterium]
MNEINAKVLNEVEKLRDDMVKTLTRICKIPAVSPHNGGTGEQAKAQELEKIVNELGLGQVKWEYVDDAKSQTGNRPSLFVERAGKSKRRLCILSHMDIVPEGDLGAWTHDPYDPIVRDGRLYGRGVSDNGMCLVASLFALKALMNAGLKPEYTINLCLVADEEMGSHFGLEPLMERGLFRTDDLVIAPDSGNENGDFIEIAEKAMWRLNFTVTGSQAHASRPNSGLNACRAANILAVEVDEALHKAFGEIKDDRFNPNVSTFEPTRRFANVPSTNIIPGKERFEFDCRVLPSVSLDEAEELVKKVVKDVEQRTGAKIELEVDRTDAAEPTSADSDVAKILIKAVEQVLNLTPKTGGIGGGTFAALFRRKGIPAVVWSQEIESAAHQPDEYIEINYLVNNAKVFALMMLGE